MEARSSRSPLTTSAPRSANSLAAAFSVSRVNARTAKPRSNRFLAVVPPCWPVAPLTRITRLSLPTLSMLCLLAFDFDNFFHKNGRESTLKSEGSAVDCCCQGNFWRVVVVERAKGQPGEYIWSLDHLG